MMVENFIIFSINIQLLISRKFRNTFTILSNFVIVDVHYDYWGQCYAL